MNDTLQVIEQKRERLQALTEKSEAVTDDFLEAIKNIFGVNEIHESVEKYLKSNVETKYVSDLFSVFSVQRALKRAYTYEEVFQFKYANDIFPMLNIGYTTGIDFYAMIETGQILSIHHDSLVEYGWDYFDEDDGLELIDSLKRMLSDMSIFSLTDILKLHENLSAYSDSELDGIEIPEMRRIVAESFSWTDEELDKKTGKLAMEFLYERLEED